MNILIQNFLLVNYVALTFYREYFFFLFFFFGLHIPETRLLFSRKEGQIRKVKLTGTARVATFWGRVSTFIPTISVLVPLFFSPARNLIRNYLITSRRAI